MSDKNKESNDNPPTTALAVPDDEYSQIVQQAKLTLGDRLTSIVDVLDDETAETQIIALQQSMSPDVKGRSEMNTRWSIPVIRVIQNMTRERPGGAAVGQMYTDSGEVLAVDKPFKFVPLYIYEQNRMFQQGEFKAPTCAAPDAKLGTAFGACNQCPELPMGKNTTGAGTQCDNGICMVVLAQNMRLYRLEFYKTSKKAGLKVDTTTQRQGSLWSKWFDLKTKGLSNAKGEYHVFLASSTVEETLPHVREAADALCDMIIAERQAFLRVHYEQVKRAAAGMGDVDEQVSFDVQGTNPDLSGDGM